MEAERVDARGVRIRKAVQGDSDEVATVWLRARRASVPSIPAPVHTDEEVRTWFREVVLPKREVWVAALEARVVGLLVLDEGWVEQLYVEPGLTGRRIGTRLLDVAKSRYPSGLDLWTFEANAGARRFYERHGFIAVEWTCGQNEEGAPDVRYHWPGDASLRIKRKTV